MGDSRADEAAAIRITQFHIVRPFELNCIIAYLHDRVGDPGLARVISTDAVFARSLLLHAEQHQNLTGVFIQRLESLPDKSAGTVYRIASKIKRL